MRNPVKTTDVAPRRSVAGLLRISLGLGLIVGSCASLWSSLDTNGMSLASYMPVPFDSRVAALTSELAQLKAETARLRRGHDDTSEELSHIRASIANTEIGLASLRTSTGDSEVRRRQTADNIESQLAQLKHEALRLRTAQDDTATELSSLRAGAANSEIGIDKLRTTTAEIRQQVSRIEIAREATSSIGEHRRHHHPRSSVQNGNAGAQSFAAQWPGVLGSATKN